MNHMIDLTQQVNSGLLVEDVLQHIFDSFRTIIPYDRLGCALLDQEGTTVHSIWARTLAPNMRVKIG